jgi:hypothetical protein
MSRRAKIVAGVGAGWVGVLAGYAVNRAAPSACQLSALARTSGELRGGHRADVNSQHLLRDVQHGRPVLVLHGATAFLETMHYQIRGLVPGHRSLADSRAPGAPPMATYRSPTRRWATI